ncbi:MAG: hypothetical protein WCK02_07220 [Bacteroidota bacterium]
MKTIILLVFACVFSLACQAQCCPSKQGCTKSIMKPLSLNSLQKVEINTIKLPNYTLNINKSSRFTLFHDTIERKLVLYDNCKKVYWQNDPIRPYNTVENTLVLGSINYLILLFDKK